MITGINKSNTVNSLFGTSTKRPSKNDVHHVESNKGGKVRQRVNCQTVVLFCENFPRTSIGRFQKINRDFY